MQVTRADRTMRDPVYGAYKWWARRPRSVIRAVLLAAHLPADTSEEKFWELFASDLPHLDGFSIGDCFAGGGTTLVEAARLGARVTGIDVDPLAVRIVRDHLAEPSDRPDQDEELLAHLQSRLSALYPVAADGAEPLHYFWLREIRCTDCKTKSLLYRSLRLARDDGRRGGVNRNGTQAVFCPTCQAVHSVSSDEHKFVCCDQVHEIQAGTCRSGRFVCPWCQRSDSIRTLKVAQRPERLIAIEDTPADGRRRFRAPAAADLRAQQVATRAARARQAEFPNVTLAGIDGGRASAYGFKDVAALFRPRQQLLFAEATDFIGQTSLRSSETNRLTLVVANAVQTNNRLCGYATDYGRLAAAFAGIRSYSFPCFR